MAERTCSIEGCEIPVNRPGSRGAHGWCKRHYDSYIRHGDPVVVDRPRLRDAAGFWAMVVKTEGCWEWTGAKFKTGYGAVNIGHRIVTTHRRSWELTNGPIPEGLFVLHHCDNRPCVRPDHLFLGTHQDNMTDMVSKGRQKNGWARTSSPA